MTMKTRTNLVLVVGLVVGLLLCAVTAFGQETAIERWNRIYSNPRLSPATKMQLYSHDPNVCHCDECRRARLAAGVEYMGMTPIKKPRRLTTPPPLVYTPVTPPPPAYTAPLTRFYGLGLWCGSRGIYVKTAEKCPKG